MTSEVCGYNCDCSDVAMCVGFVLMLFGVATLAASYFFTYNLADAAASSAYISARETEAAEMRAWTAFTVPWTTGLALVAFGVIIFTVPVVYNSCRCPVTSPHDDSIPLSGQTRTSYGSSADN